MLDYVWGNPQPTVMIPTTGVDEDDQTTPDSDHHHHHQSRHLLDHYSAAQAFNNETNLLHSSNNSHFPQNNYHNLYHHQQQQQTHPQMHSLFDPRAFSGSYPPSFDSVLAGGGSSGYMLMPKTEPSFSDVDYATRIGLNLGGRTYFSSSEDDFVNRLYRRSRSDSAPINSPRCQAEGCNADLTHAKHYHRRHKVCEYHSKASTVIAAGLTQRFCQQCSRFHLLAEFDNGKRSCRKRLADHNRRRRKSNQQNNAEQKQNLEIATASSSDTVAKSPAESAAQSSSSVTVAVSPPRISLECFRQGSPSRHTLFFSNV